MEVRRAPIQKRLGEFDEHYNSGIIGEEVMLASAISTFDSSQMHPGAKEALDREGELLVTRFTLKSHSPMVEEPFSTRFKVGILRARSVDPVCALVDFAGRTEGWVVQSVGQAYTLDETGYLSLRHCVERLQRSPPFHRGFSGDFIEKCVVRWCARRLGGEIAETLSTSLLIESAAAFATLVILVPLSNVEIEQDFDLGDVRIVTMDPSLFTKTREHARLLRPEDPAAGSSSDQMADIFGNCAAVEVRVCGEPQYAREQALAIAHDAAGVLRFLSPATVAISVPSLVHPHGFAPTPSHTLFKVRDGRIIGSECRLSHVGLATWKLSAREIDRLAQGPLVNLHLLFKNHEETEFVAHVRNAFFAYCRALSRFEIAERLVDTISALEALLLGGTEGPLQTIVGERLAFLTTRTVNERLQVFSDYKRAYAMRSGAVHHLRGIKDEEAANRLLRHAFIVFYKAIEALSLFTHTSEFFGGLDRIKFSGSYASAQREFRGD